MLNQQQPQPQRNTAARNDDGALIGGDTAERTVPRPPTATAIATATTTATAAATVATVCPRFFVFTLFFISMQCALALDPQFPSLSSSVCLPQAKYLGPATTAAPPTVCSRFCFIFILITMQCVLDPHFLSSSSVCHLQAKYLGQDGARQPTATSRTVCSRCFILFSCLFQCNAPFTLTSPPLFRLPSAGKIPPKFPKIDIDISEGGSRRGIVSLLIIFIVFNPRPSLPLLFFHCYRQAKYLTGLFESFIWISLLF